MKFSVITPSYNSERFIETTLRSIARQREQGADLQHIVVDGGSTDGTLAVLDAYRAGIDVLISEPDHGPVDAINKGLKLATGDAIAWLNADDVYHANTLHRVAKAFEEHPHASFVFGGCRIIDEEGKEIRRGITRFKETFFPISSRFTLQCINYISQPAMFFSREAFQEAGLINEAFTAAWDYDFSLRLAAAGRFYRIPGPPLSDFRWHPGSISGSTFRTQFREEWEIAARDAGRFSLQSLLHLGVRWGIVASYSGMATTRRFREKRA